MNPVRFIVRVESNWHGQVTCDGDDAWARPIALTELDTEGGPRLPALDVPLHAPDSAHDGLTGSLSAADVRDLVTAVLARTAEPAQIACYGHYLFDALLGPELWGEIERMTEQRGAHAIELALRLPDDADGALHRLNWELMHSDAGFLAAPGPKHDVAITRIVDSAHAAPTPLDVPPRVLFVVGTSLTEDRIRPGAELYGLMRRARGGRAMRYRLLEQASPTRIRQAVKEFHPEIVHIICHGGIDDDGVRVFLNLETDEQDAEPKRYAQQLAFDLRDGDWRPTVVVLSACLTAGTQETPQYVLASAHETAPFAATLVENGIPIVLGMAGRVADITSRLFARTLGEALIRGKPLVLATAKARQVTFAGMPDPEANADWAFPAVFLAGNVPPGYRPVDAARSDALWQQIENWIEASNFVEPPVFTGRESILARMPQLFESPGEPRGGQERRRRALLVIAERQDRGIGRSRLLKEIGAEAFRGGHLPLLLQFESGDAPRNLKQFLTELSQAIGHVREYVLEIGDAESSQLALLDREDAGVPGLDPGIAADLRSRGALTEGALRRALRADLATLLADARRKIPFFAGSGGQVVLLLDDVDRYGELAAQLLAATKGLLGPAGFGTLSEPIPVIMTASRGGTTDALLRELQEKPQSIGWLTVEKLEPLRSDGEDLLACQTVLLNPFEEAILPDVSGVPWAFNDAVDAKLRAMFEHSFRLALKGMPIEFHSDRIYIVAQLAAQQQIVVRAEDDLRMQSLPRQL